MRSRTVSESVLFVDAHVFVCIPVCGVWGRECLSTNIGVCVYVCTCVQNVSGCCVETGYV